MMNPTELLMSFLENHSRIQMDTENIGYMTEGGYAMTRLGVEREREATTFEESVRSTGYRKTACWEVV